MTPTTSDCAPSGESVLARAKMDLADSWLPGLPMLLRPAGGAGGVDDDGHGGGGGGGVVGVAKHLCGCATDFALRGQKTRRILHVCLIMSISADAKRLVGGFFSAVQHRQCAGVLCDASGTTGGACPRRRDRNVVH